MKILHTALMLLFCLSNSSSFAEKVKEAKADSEELDCANDQYWGTQDRCAALAGEAARKATISELKKKYGAVWSREVLRAVDGLQKLVREFSQLEARATSDSVHGEYSSIENYVWRRWFNDIIQQMETGVISEDESNLTLDSDKKLNAIYSKDFKNSEECKKAQRQWLKVRDEIAEIYQLRFNNKLKPSVLRNIAVNRTTIRRIEDYQARLNQ